MVTTPKVSQEAQKIVQEEPEDNKYTSSLKLLVQHAWGSNQVAKCQIKLWGHL
jgi:hypothetical protein